MAEQILLVDDEPNVLHALQRQLRGRYTVHTAESGEAALRLCREAGPFAVIVSDMRMPGMNGVELLATVKALYPDTVRLMLTGNADQETAIEAVNSGQIFRFLTKPCPPALLLTSLALAVRQHRLQTAEQELLQETLRGSVSVLCELLGVTSPLAGSAGLRLRDFVVDAAAALRLPHPWQYETAALLSQIGCIGLPPETLSKFYSGRELSAEEAEQFDRHPEAAARLLEPIPRLENVTAMIRLQRLRYADFTDELRQTLFAEVLIGAQLLRAAVDYDCLLFQGRTRGEALTFLRGRRKVYNPEVLDALATVRPTRRDEVLSLRVDQVSAGMVAMDDVLATNGALVVARGQQITPLLLRGLINFSRKTGIVEPIRVRVGLYAGGDDTQPPDPVDPA